MSLEDGQLLQKESITKHYQEPGAVEQNDDTSGEIYILANRKI
jgi:hypothetical protein